MLLQEAQWLNVRLAEMDVGALSPLLDLGSSTRHFREVEQPYIESVVFRPLAARGCKVYHVDIKAEAGVDVVADVFADADYGKLRELRPRSLINTSMLEHVRDPSEALRRFLGLLPSGGVLFLSVPYSFPYHADPLDTMFRPSPAQLESMLAGHEIRRCEIVNGTTLIGEIMTRRSLRSAGEPTFGAGWRPRPQVLLHLLWLWRPYRITCAVVVKR